MNTNMKANLNELNLNEMELISGGRWKWADGLISMAIGAVSLGGLGACLGGVPGAVIGTAVGIGVGAGLTFAFT